MSERRAKWAEYDAYVAAWYARKLAPAFVQECEVGGLWSVQVLVHRKRHFGWWHRFFNDPPTDTNDEPFYNGWPGDHRGWMRFQTKEEARDFYKVDTGRITFDQYRLLGPKRGLSGVTINLNDAGDFAADGEFER